MSRLTAALLLSCESFEDFFGRQLGLDREAWTEQYRNDYSWAYVEALREQDVDLLLYVATTGAGERRTSRDGVGVRFLPLAAAARAWGRHPLLWRGPALRWAGQAVGGVGLLRALREAVAADGVDVLYQQEYWTGRFDVLARLGTRPLVVADHGYPARHQVKAFKRGAFSRTAAVTVQTEHERNAVARRGARAVVVSNGVDTDWYRPAPAPPPGAPRLLTVARLNEDHKRTSELVHSLRHLPEAWQLDVAGSGPDEGALRELVRGLGLDARVRFLGFVSDRDQLRALYHGATVFGFPSAYEAGPTLALLEAMSCGLPVVVHDLPVFRDVVSDGATGVVVGSRAPDALAAGILRAAADREAVGARARRQVVLRYSVQHTGEVLAGVLRRAAGRG